ncbi:MAG: aldo/keto reductase [Thermoproteus sp.]
MEKKCFKAVGCVSALGLGTSGLGGDLWRADTSRDERHLAVLANALANGIFVIDTSEIYGGGHAEELVGRALSTFAREDRDKVIVITKFWPDDVEKITLAAKASARRLGTYIDVYMPHGPLPDICRAVRAFEELIDRGVIRFWGLSNVDVDTAERARKCAKKYDLAALENVYSYINRLDEHGVLPYAQREGLLYLAASPLARGAVVENYRIRRVAERLGRTPVQVALRWLMDKPAVVPIPRTTRPEGVLEFAGAYGWKLPDEHVRELDAG